MEPPANIKALFGTLPLYRIITLDVPQVKIRRVVMVGTRFPLIEAALSGSESASIRELWRNETY